MNDLRIIGESEYQQMLLNSVCYYLIIVRLSQTLCGIGTFSTVRRAAWSEIHIAVKSFREGRTVASKEFNILLNCCHSNVVKMLAAGPDKRTINFIILELADRGSIAKILHHCTDTHYSISHAICWLLHVARALDYLHRVLQPSIIHGDVKPDNILLFSGGRVAKLTDFGSATVLGESGIHQKFKQKTLVYAAPELIHFQSDSISQLTAKCDIYSWAITCWEILARRRPYNTYSASCRITFWDVYGRRPPLLRQCPDLLQRLVIRAWDENPLQRPYVENIVSLLDFVHHKMLLQKGELAELTSTEELSRQNSDFLWEAEDSPPKNEAVISTPIPSAPQELFVSTKGENRPHGNPGSLNVLTGLSLQTQLNSS